mgnify:FL=1
MFSTIMDWISVGLIPILIALFILYGLYKKVDVYGCFINGAVEGFNTVVRIIPYLVAIFVAIGALRGSGTLEIMQKLVGPVFDRFNLTADMVPHIITRSLSGSGSTGVMAELVNNYGPDSFIGRVASVFQGGTSTTMYIITVYLGAVGIKKVRHTVAAGLITDIASFIMSVIIVAVLFGY